MGEQGKSVKRVNVDPLSHVELGAMVDTSELSTEQEAFLEAIAREMEATFETMVDNIDEMDDYKQAGRKFCNEIDDSTMSIDEEHAKKRKSIRSSAIFAATIRQYRYGRS